MTGKRWETAKIPNGIRLSDRRLFSWNSPMIARKSTYGCENQVGNISDWLQTHCRFWVIDNHLLWVHQETLERRVIVQAKVRLCFITMLLFLTFLLAPRPCTVLADQQTISLGYGLGVLNNTRQVGHLRGNDYYDFGQIAYGYEKTLSGKFSLLIEPFVSIVNRPKTGLDFGLTLNGRYYFGPVNHRGFFATAGGGGACTSIKFHEQGTHGLFVLHGGVGYKWERLLVEGRFRHYSNAGLAHPNRSVNATVVSAGYAF
jgi:hypothetical protein